MDGLLQPDAVVIGCTVAGIAVLVTDFVLVVTIEFVSVAFTRGVPTEKKIFLLRRKPQEENLPRYLNQMGFPL